MREIWIHRFFFKQFIQNLGFEFIRSSFVTIRAMIIISSAYPFQLPVPSYSDQRFGFIFPGSRIFAIQNASKTLKTFQKMVFAIRFAPNSRIEAAPFFYRMFALRMVRQIATRLRKKMIPLLASFFQTNQKQNMQPFLFRETIVETQIHILASCGRAVNV